MSDSGVVHFPSTEKVADLIAQIEGMAGKCLAEGLAEAFNQSSPRQWCDAFRLVANGYYRNSVEVVGTNIYRFLNGALLRFNGVTWESEPPRAAA